MLRPVRALLRSLGAPPEIAAEVAGALARRLREPHRRYHTAEHVAEVMSEIESLLAAASTAHGDAVRLAGWFHDAVYDPGAPTGANEEASARLATSEVRRAGLGIDLAEETGRLVRATATHVVAVGDESAAVLVDADLAILAAPSGRYDCYVRQIRAEYGRLDDDAWRSGRTAVLRRFLASPELFRIGADRDQRDVRARANMARELAALGLEA